MKAKLIAHTTPVDSQINANSANEYIAYVARVSNPSNQHNNLTADRLINYLMKHKHFSPFEHYSLTLEVNTTLDIATQLLRHRSFVFQQFSGRYADMQDLTGEMFTTAECRLQDTKNRQNSLENTDEKLAEDWTTIQGEIMQDALHAYKTALDFGIAKELARKVLPIGLTNTRMYVTGNIRSFIHYLLVRLDPTTQKEHRQLAKAIYDEVNKVFDLSVCSELKELYEQA